MVRRQGLAIPRTGVHRHGKRRATTCSLTSDDLLDGRIDLGLRHCASDLFGDLPLLEKDQGRDGADAVLTWRLGVLINVALAHLQLAVILRSQFRNNRSDGPTGSAPWGPEIHENRHG